MIIDESSTPLSMNNYQDFARTTAIYPDAGHNMTYPVLGLAGESGEIANKYKKVIRDKAGLLDDETKMAIASELGDVLWYVAQCASELGFSLDAIAKENVKKLQKRQASNTLKGSGDER